MTESETGQPGREKVVSKLPPPLRQELKITAAIRGVAIQDAVEAAITAWMEAHEPIPEAATSGATSFATYLPEGMFGTFKEICAVREVSHIQGLAQGVVVWIGTDQPIKRFAIVRRIVFCNQKGGVGKTSGSAAVGAALAELGYRVLLVDFDPQGHLTVTHGAAKRALASDSLSKHMVGKGQGPLRDIIVPIAGERFRDRLFLLPSCVDAFLLDVQLSTLRGREYAMSKALKPLEEDYDFILVDCPPSLGMSMDTALQYAGRREGEVKGNSGAVIPVEAEDTSADAYSMLIDQIASIELDLEVEVEVLGLLVNKYSANKGYIATSSLDQWHALQDPPVLGVVGDLKEQREAVRAKRALLDYDPGCDQSQAARSVARKLINA
jgi:chromosome partitioning protein